MSKVFKNKSENKEVIADPYHIASAVHPDPMLQSILTLQSTIGNQAVQRMVNSYTIQRQANDIDIRFTKAAENWCNTHKKWSNERIRALLMDTVIANREWIERKSPGKKIQLKAEGQNITFIFSYEYLDNNRLRIVLVSPHLGSDL